MEEKDIDKLKSDQTDDRDYTVEDINDIMPTNKDDYGMEDIDSIADIDNIVGTVSPDTDSDQINNIYAADGSDPDEGTDEEIVFASSGTKRESVPKKNAAPVSALSLPKIPVKAVAIAVAALIGIGLLSTIISCFGNRSVPTSADADNSGGQIDHLTVPQGNSEYEIKNINTSNIKFGDNVTVEGLSDCSSHRFCISIPMFLMFLYKHIITAEANLIFLRLQLQTKTALRILRLPQQ